MLWRTIRPVVPVCASCEPIYHARPHFRQNVQEAPAPIEQDAKQPSKRERTQASASDQERQRARKYGRSEQHRASATFLTHAHKCHPRNLRPEGHLHRRAAPAARCSGRHGRGDRAQAIGEPGELRPRRPAQRARSPTPGERFPFRAVPTPGNRRRPARHGHERRSVPKFPDTAPSSTGHGAQLDRDGPPSYGNREPGTGSKLRAHGRATAIGEGRSMSLTVAPSSAKPTQATGPQVEFCCRDANK